MANVLILSLIFSPDNVSTAQIMAGLAADLARAGHTVRVLTTTPHFHRDASLEAARPLAPWLGRLVMKSARDGVTAYHVRMPDKSVWPPLRMLSWIWFHAATTVLSLFIRFRPDVLLACSPPLTIGLNAWAIGLLRRCPYVYNVQELYPDIAVNLGLMKNRAAIGFFRRVERVIYRRAAAVTSITDTMCATIRARTDPAKVRLIPNFVDLPPAPPPAARPAADVFTVTYAGNMGVPQKLDVLLEAAPFLAPAVRLRFVGAGGAKAALVRRAAELGAANVTFLDYQPLARMPAITAATDLFYAGQAPQACGDGIPSKIYRILGAGKPILAVTSPGSDMAAFVRASGGGAVVEDFDPRTVAREINALAADPARAAAAGARGRAYVAERFSRARVSGLYDALVRDLAGHGGTT